MNYKYIIGYSLGYWGCAAAQYTLGLAPNPGWLSMQILGWALTLPVVLLIEHRLSNEQ